MLQFGSHHAVSISTGSSLSLSAAFNPQAFFFWTSVLFAFAGTGRRSSSPRSAWVRGSWCSLWPRPYASRFTCTASGLSAGTRTQARSCPTTTTTRKAPSSPPSGRSRTSCLPSSSSCSRCTRRASSSWVSRTARRGQSPEVRRSQAGILGLSKSKTWGAEAF